MELGDGPRVDPLIDAVNALTVRWAGAACSPAESAVFSGAGVWPLLGFLAAGAAGPGRRELLQALGTDALDPVDAARSVLEVLAAAPSVRSALGLWTRRKVRLNPQWAERLPAGTRGELTGNFRTDRTRLDTWAREQTDSLIPAMPMEIDKDTRLVLAGALVVRTAWCQPFTECSRQITDGPWAGRRLPMLARTVKTMSGLQVADTPHGPLTVLSVAGWGDIDVHLLLGTPTRTAGDVLAAGTAALAGRCPRTGGDALPEGNPAPGVTVQLLEKFVPGDVLSQLVPRFTVTSSHDLLATPEVFGLRTVTDTSRGHFPGIGDEPLAVGRACQNVRASFQALGFEAAAVTAFPAAAGAAPPQSTHQIRYVQVCFDRPFGFLAVHRPSGLILTAGWIAQPEPAESASEPARSPWRRRWLGS